MVKLTLNEIIFIRTKLSYERINSIFQSNILQDFNIFPDKIMTGRIENGEITAIINPPNGWSDPFKSRVKGSINKENELVTVNLRISLSWTIIAFYFIWYSLFLLILYGLIFKSSNDGFEIFVFLLMYFIFPLGLGKLKIIWDRRRLEKWIEKKIKAKLYNK